MSTTAIARLLRPAFLSTCGLAAALTTACSDAPSAPSASAPDRAPADAPSSIISDGGTGFDPVETFRATLRVENVHFNGNGTWGAVPGMTGVEITGAKVRFTVISEVGAAAATREFVDNSAQDSDKRPGYFNVPLPLVGTSVRASLVSVPSPWTTAKAINPASAYIKSEPTAIGKLFVNRRPQMGVGFLVGNSYMNNLTYGYSVTGPGTFFVSGTTVDYTGFSVLPEVGVYRVCETATPAGYKLTSAQCVDWYAPLSYNGGPTFQHAKL